MKQSIQSKNQVARPTKARRWKSSSPQLDQRVPSAPEFDQESLCNVLDEMPERVERPSQPSIWTRIRRTLSTKYKPMEEDGDEANRPELTPPAYARTGDFIWSSDLA